MKHLLSLEKTDVADIEAIIKRTAYFKRERKSSQARPLRGQTWAMIFAKSSTRTRVSFEVGIRELGGEVIFLNASDIQLGRGEPIKDTARVLGRMVHGAIIRTYAQVDVEEFAAHANIPTINALTDQEHPCQILADIFSYEEKRGSIKGKVVTFVGDGACNVPISWMFAAAKLGFELRIAAPQSYQPEKELLARAGGRALPGAAAAYSYASGGKIVLTEDLKAAAKGADLLYTDVWVSMGKEAESDERIKLLVGYTIDDALVKLANPGAMVMHCLPAYKNKEIAESTFEAHADTIFEQAENRLHAQKAVLEWAVGK